jgi:hypothetical protein
MYKAVPVDLAECFRQANGNAQEASQMERLVVSSLKNPIQGLAARILEYEDRTPFVTSSGQKLGRQARSSSAANEYSFSSRLRL